MIINRRTGLIKLKQFTYFVCKFICLLPVETGNRPLSPQGTGETENRPLSPYSSGMRRMISRKGMHSSSASWARWVRRMVSAAFSMAGKAERVS